MNKKQKKSDKQILEAQKEKLKVLKDELNELHFLNLEEIEDILKRMQFMPEKAHDEVLQIIESAKLKQNDFFKEQIKKNPEFIHEVEHKVHQEYKKVIQKITEEESSNADSILDQLYENI